MKAAGSDAILHCAAGPTQLADTDSCGGTVYTGDQELDRDTAMERRV